MGRGEEGAEEDGEETGESVWGRTEVGEMRSEGDSTFLTSKVSSEEGWRGTGFTDGGTKGSFMASGVG